MGCSAGRPSQQLHEPVINALGMSDEQLRPATAFAWRRLRQRIHALRPPAPPPTLHGRMVILVDEGAAQGVLLQEAAGLVRRTGARTLVAAVPVASRAAPAALDAEFDDVICPGSRCPSTPCSPPSTRDFLPRDG